MPKFRVTTPDGRTFEVTAPEGATKDDAIAYVQEMLVAKAAPEEPVYDEPNVMERLGHGAAQVTQGAKQLWLRGTDPEAAQSYEQERNADEARYQAGRGPGAGVDWASLAGTAGALAPLMLIPGGASTAALPGETAAQAAAVARLGTLARAGLGGASGAAGAGLMYTPNWQDKGSQVAGGALIGGMANVALPPAAAAVGRGVGNAVDAVKGALTPKAYTINVQATQQVNQALQSAGIPQNLWNAVRGSLDEDVRRVLDTGGLVDPEQLARLARQRAIGLRPTVGSVTRDPMQWQTERELAVLNPTGAPLRGLLTENNQVLSQRADELAGLFGPARGDYETGRLVIDTADDVSRGMQRAVGSAYDEAANTAGWGQRAADVSALKNRLIEIYDAFADRIPGAVDEKLRALVDGKLAPTVENLNRVQKIVNQRKPADAETGEALRQIRAAITDALDSTAAAGGGSAAKLREAVKLARTRFGLIEGRANRPTRLIQDLIDNRADADRFVRQRVIGGNTDDLTSLKTFLTETPPEFSVDTAKGRGAWDAIRRGVIDQLNDKAQLPSGVDRQFSGAMWRKAWESLGARRNVLFDADERKMIEMLITGAEEVTTDVPYHMGNASKTAGNWWNMAARLSGKPIIGDLANALKRMIEDRVQQGQVSYAVSGSMTPVIPPRVAPMPAAVSGMPPGMLMSAPAIAQGLLYQQGQ